jgi:hypothetical protein
MKIFGYELKKAPETKNFVTSTPFQMGATIGQDIQKNMATYYKMYRVDADIRRCIEEKQQTV